MVVLFFYTFVPQTTPMRYLIFCFLILSLNLQGQLTDKALTPQKDDTLIVNNGDKDSMQIFQPTIYDYQFKTQHSPYQIFDTVFTAEKTFVYSQFNNKDNFGKILFPNIGQPFNPLVYQPDAHQNLAVLPTGKSFNILGVEDIKYYDVKTPTTTFELHNGVGSGAALNSTYTQNIGKNLNFVINYMGLRTNGHYQRNLSVNNHFNIALHYRSKNGRYEAYAHYLNQNVNNEENGGIAVLDQFLGDDTRFNNRQNVEINLEESQSFFSYRRYYLSHDFGLFKIKDSYPLKLRHQFKYEINKYYFEQSQIEAYYATQNNPVIAGFPLSTKKHSHKLTNVVSLVFDRENFKLDAGLLYQNVILGGNHVFYNNQVAPVKWTDNRIGAVGNLEVKLWKRIDLQSHAQYSTGDKFGNFIELKNKLSIVPAEGFEVSGKVNFQSAVPSFNYMFNGSAYQNFNYLRSDLDHQTILEVGGMLKTKWLHAKAFFNYYNIGNYTYIDANYQPQQASSLNITQVGGEATFDFNKFHLNARVLFQSALDNKELYPMPNFIGRASLYYQNKIFKDVATLQGGVKAYYFTKFNSREFFPVLNEFVLPGSDAYAIGGQPIATVFANLKVKSMMIFVEAQHLNALLKNKSFAAPFYPVADFRLNLGIVWYIFS